MAIEGGAREAQLSENSVKKISKDKKVVAAMVTTITFFWLTLRARVEALGLTPTVEQAVYQHLIPGIHLELVTEKVADPSKNSGSSTPRKNCWLPGELPMAG